MKYWLVFIFLVSMASCLAQKTVIKAGWVVNPATESLVENQLIFVNDGQIEKITDNIALPKDYEVVDLSDAWVLPGLMDAHVHITWNGQYGNPQWYGIWVKESIAFRAMRGLKVAKEYLNAGFTTIKEIGNDLDYATADIMKAIDAGWYEGPTIQYAGKIIAPYGGQTGGVSYQNKGFWTIDFIDADTDDEIVKAIRQNIYHGATTIKMVSDQHNYYYDRDDIALAVKEAGKSGLKVTVHVMGGPAAKEVILGGAAAIEHGFNLDRPLLELMKEKGTFLVGTDFSFQNFIAYGDTETQAQKNEDRMVQRLKMAHEVGVKMAFGTDIVINLPKKNRVESSLEVLKTWKKAKIPPVAILQAMTCNAAELMDMANSHGQLSPNFQADIIACKANPLEDIDHIKQVRFVMKNGKIIVND